MRDADKDREIIAMDRELPVVRAIGLHWLERAVSAEQRVAELEDTLRRMMKILEPDAKPYQSAAYAYHEAFKSLRGGTDNDKSDAN